MKPPSVALPEDLRAALEQLEAGLATRLLRELVELRRPCVHIRSRRISRKPLRTVGVGRLLRGLVAAPVLDVAAGKFGGSPYTEGGEDWDGWRFVGQFDLTSANTLCPQLGISGLLRLDASVKPFDAGFRTRWFPSPSESKATPSPRASSMGKWEAAHELGLGWSLPQKEQGWLRLIPDGHDALREALAEWEPTGFNADEKDALHRVLGWPAAGLDEPYGFVPPDGCSEDVTDYEMLLRLTYDNAAGFAWGTNWIYVLVPRDDLRRGDLSRTVVATANC